MMTVKHDMCSYKLQITPCPELLSSSSIVQAADSVSNTTFKYRPSRCSEPGGWLHEATAASASAVRHRSGTVSAASSACGGHIKRSAEDTKSHDQTAHTTLLRCKQVLNCSR